MDSGFADQSGIYDPVGDRVPGNLTNFLQPQSQFIDVLGLVETSAWSEEGSQNHPSIKEIAQGFGFENYHLGSNLCLMAHEPIEVLEESGNPIIAQVGGVVYILAAMSANSYPTKKDDFLVLAEKVAEYQHTPTLVMGDLNAISPLDRARYNSSLLCGNGTYNPDDQTGEYVANFCLEGEDGSYDLDFTPMETLMNNTDLVDLCFYSGGFWDIDTDMTQESSMCAFSNPTLLIHMTGSYGSPGGSHGHSHAQAKIDYVLANVAMLEHMRFRHSTVVRGFQADGASDHYPLEATFLR
eukprot:CAMPEP_0197552254 /NCGR_PEP_ID=MMETSP1320-20131121/5828_1 /TAXON_ID=91990 /ORGANISM="Bolidomonas sp., Strain RCC2347" /LENGTH=295 /DNA_ID=CAMNT_0043112831 /DNA_START=99 /DNA_END=986 /DNA_ORIENTATION=+